MFAADASNESAIEHVYRIKNRPKSNPIHVAVATYVQAATLGFIGAKAERLMENFMPGPITVIVPKKESVLEILVASTGTVGIRIPDSPVVLQFCAEFGRPLTATSVNLANEHPLTDMSIIVETFGDQIDFIVESQGFPYSQPSTVVRILNEKVEILRKGQIPAQDILRVAEEISYCDVKDWT
jgi:L-threonylcarbamoyladenylate synthase